MGGKAALLVILGFSSIMLIVGLNMNRVSTSAVDNSTGYFEKQQATEIARSGINLAASNLSRNPGWTPTTDHFSYNGTNNLDINVEDSSGIKILTTVGRYQGQSKLIEVKIELASFSEYAYFSDVEGNIWWTAKDSVWGPFHTNDQIQVKQHPYFAGPRTSHGGIMKYYTNAAADAPTIIGTYSPGVTIDIPTDGITDLAASAGAGGHVFNGSLAEVTFKGDSISYRLNGVGSFTTVLGTDLAPNKVLYVKNCNVKIKGTVKGNWTIGGNENVYIDDDIVYSDVPDYKDKFDTSQDLLGIVAQQNVLVSDNVANRSSVNIHAAIYCQEGSFTAENYTTRPLSGTIHLIGGITQKSRGGVGTFSTNPWTGVVTTLSGFSSKDYKYDNRLLRMVPPYFPSTRKFKILSWLE